MSDLLAARAQMGLSLAFHIIFSAISIGLPLFMCLAEALALRTKDETWLRLARNMARPVTILVAIGAVSGTVVSFEMGLLWPTYMKYTGAIIGLPFTLEGLAFFVEAIFLGLYLYGWRRLSPRVHWLCSIPICLGGVLSSWFIVSVNSWMNTPAGFVIKNGRVTDINPLQAIFNPSTPYETLHTILAVYVASSLGIAAIFALGMLRGKRDRYHRYGLTLAMAMAVVVTPLQLFAGDLSAKFLVHAQPTKFAAIEGVFQTETGGPMRLGGWADPATGKVYYAIEVPYALGILAKGDPNATIQGLESFAPQDRPEAVPFIHLAFDGMVGGGMFALMICVAFWGLFFLRKRRICEHRLLLLGVVLAGPLAFMALELGWMVTELGRQPWAIYGVLRTRDAVTTIPTPLSLTLIIFSLIYLLLASVSVYLLLHNGRVQRPDMTVRPPSSQRQREKAGV
ncbi:cytochrome ubiquinol oxidase subunit I [Reticulibacter mediterranei]|uniref:Cytochrome ubiquinol oxidase subunit I n=1 Tax=Reticulibacter mediterranei TaxID=2778369 RepID=A0A8J3IK13_9CHLR|nr:cytochrome ubiquinol oxidase subunit I [Reticulibacter mediterranei]GHO92205.1 cytochrome ubiquinol oxidase subunit I [Reticulibacter mediterranei]